MAIILKNATFIDWKSMQFKRRHIQIEKGARGSMEFIDKVPSKNRGDSVSETDIILNCKNKLVTKSFANAHHHVYSALARGMPAPRNSPTNFYEILKNIWWRLDKALDAEIIKASALATAISCAKSGVTFIIDHHSSPTAIEHSLQIISDAFDSIGVSHLLCYELSDRDGENAKEKGLRETETYLQSGHQGLVGLHASFTVGDDLLARAVALAEKYNSGIHVHAAEDAIDQQECLQKYHRRVIERFSEAGVLDFDKTILAHCIHINDRERELLRQSNAYIAQNTESNLNNNVGVFNPEGLGSRILLGTDGMYSDMLKSTRAAFLLGQQFGVSPLQIYQRFRKIHDYTEQNGLSGDDENNLVILDYDSPTEINQSNFLSHFIYGIESHHVDSVISSGELIVHRKKLLTADEDEILLFSREMGKKLWEKSQNY